MLFLLLISGVVGVLVWHLILKMYWLRSKMPPGPFPIPLVGNFLYFKGAKEDMGPTAYQFSKIYGEPMTVWLGNRPSIFMHSPKVITEALVDNLHDFHDRPPSITANIFNGESQDIVFAPYNPLWLFHKKLANRALRRIIESSHLEYHATEAVEDVVERLLSVKGPVKLRDYTTSTITNIINYFCFGEKLTMDDPFFKKRIELFDDFNKLSNDLNLMEGIPGIRFLRPLIQKYLPVAQKISYTIDYQRDHAKEILMEHKKTFNKEAAEFDVRDILEAILYEQHLVRENKEQNMTDENVALLILDIFAAGVETSAVTLQWLFLQMILNPDIQEMCYQQIANVIGERTVTLLDRPNLPLIEATILETLRMHPVAPMGVPTSASKDSTLCGYFVPKGTIMITNLMGLHYDETYWENPMVFNPERFIDEGKMVIKPRTWLPFGAGKRVCLGETLAKNDLFLVVAGLIQKLKFKKNPEEEYTLDTVPNNDFNRSPKNQYSVIVETR